MNQSLISTFRHRDRASPRRTTSFMASSIGVPNRGGKNPLLFCFMPAIAKENILLIEAIHDLFSPRAAIDELWEKWDRPGIWRLPHGHFSFSLIGAPRLMANQVLKWLAARLASPRSKHFRTQGH